MIHVSCGSLKSVSLEIYLNFLSTLTASAQSQYCLHVNTSVIKKYAKDCGSVFNNVNIKEVNASGDKLCHESLLSCLNSLKPKDSLLTLPAAKVDLNSFMGHTEFLRHFWKIPNLPMTFISPRLILLLLTDHNPLKDVASLITKNLITEKINLFLNNYPGTSFIKKITFWGVNPHAGEDGALGTEEKEIYLAINSLKTLYPKINFLGPVASDGNFSVLNSPSLFPEEIIVSPYHDQGLVFLKSVLGFLAANCTFGGPFIRLSPDHGTAVNLLYKRQALYNSLLWCHQLLQKWNVAHE